MINKQLTLTALLSSCFFLFCGCGTENEESTMEIDNNPSTYVITINKKKATIDKTALVDVENKRKTVNKIVRNNREEKIKVATDYQIYLTKSSQEDVEFTVNDLKLTEINPQKSSEDTKDSAILSLCYTIKNNANKKINIHPKEAVLILDSGERIEGADFIDYWEDIFTEGKRKNGSFHFKFANTDQLKKISAFKIVFMGYITEDQETKFEKEFTFEAPLNLT